MIKFGKFMLAVRSKVVQTKFVSILQGVFIWLSAKIKSAVKMQKITQQLKVLCTDESTFFVSLVGDGILLCLIIDN